MHPRRIVAASAVAVFFGVCGGCDKAPAVKTVPAGGTVTRSGQPLEGATVNFVASGQGKGASGTTDAQGHFKLQTLASGSAFQSGAMVGDYTVTVTKPSTSGGTNVDPTKLSPEESAKLAEQMKEKNRGTYTESGELDSKKPSESQSELPSKYAEPSTSGLNATVEAGKPNDFKFDLPD
jgi:hypothetical protein